MKTKLLKKIRKRYSIERIDSLSDYEKIHWAFYNSKARFPIFYFIDNQDDYHNWAYEAFGKAYDKLLERIKVDYSKYSKNKLKQSKSEKVWWTNNK